MKFILFIGILAALAFSTCGAKSLRRRSPFTLAQFPQGLRHRSASNKDPVAPPPSIHWIRQPVNHFGFEEESRTYMQQYLVCDKFFRPSQKPASILFYTGNEGSIDQFYANSGAMFEFAEEFGSLVVFAESRYYGKSMIYKVGSQTEVDYSFFSAEQIMADYAILLKMLKEKYSIDKIISFGGSLGGMYAAYFRIKYPHVIDGAWAASAPVLGFPGLTNPYGFSQIASEDFYKFSCGTAIRQGFVALDQAIKAKQFKQLDDRFHTCQRITDEKTARKLDTFIENAIVYMGMVNYPSPATFLQPLPGYPIQKTCERINNLGHQTLFDGIFEVTNMFFNYTGQTKCFDLDGWENSNDLGFESWNYQACSEMILAIGDNGQTDFFTPKPWNLQNVSDECLKSQGIRPRPTWIPTYYGVGESKFSNIIFSNGEYDPWRAQGYTENHPDQGIHSIYVKEGAHHTCLRFTTSYDPPSVVEARNKIKNIIKGWIGL